MFIVVYRKAIEFFFYINLLSWNLARTFVSGVFWERGYFFLDFLCRRSRHLQTKTILCLPSQSVCLLFPFLDTLHYRGLPVICWKGVVRGRSCFVSGKALSTKIQLTIKLRRKRKRIFIQIKLRIIILEADAQSPENCSPVRSQRHSYIRFWDKR